MGFIEDGFFILGVLLQFLVGVIQVTSGFYYVVKYQDKFHKKYLSVALIYIAFLFLVSNAFKVPSFILIIMLFIIPTGIASWYFYRTWKNQESTDQYSNKEFQEDILDDLIF
jgi:glucan phosphoethanolaminetransferase (alkaline phosphatase superfamily)